MNAKKNSKKKASARRGKLSPEDVLRISSDIHSVGDAVGGLATAMEEQALGEVLVDGFTKKDRAIITLKEFVANLRQAIERASI